jgi:hypothetical protein
LPGKGGVNLNWGCFALNPGTVFDSRQAEAIAVEAEGDC